MIAFTFLVISGLLLIGPAIRQRIEDRTNLTVSSTPKPPRKRTPKKRAPKNERQG